LATAQQQRDDAMQERDEALRLKGVSDEIISNLEEKNRQLQVINQTTPVRRNP
jgi:hypothetical protein